MDTKRLNDLRNTIQVSFREIDILIEPHKKHINSILETPWDNTSISEKLKVVNLISHTQQTPPQ